MLNDAPVGDGAADDLLDANEVARGLADLIVASRGTAPFALAVDAAWGMGKSSLMQRLEATLAAERSVSVVWFNAWTSGRASALEGLIKSVLLRFDRNVIRRAVRFMSRRAHLLGALRAGALVAGSFFGLGRVVDEMWRRLALDAQSRNEIRGVLHDAFAAWMARGGDGDRLLVVFVDDLDRCAGERVIEVCEAIKLYLDVPGIVFVLACDQTALWRAVREAAGIGSAAGAAEYLEKIIQINYRIPVPSAVQALRLVDGYLSRSNTDQLFDESMKNVIIERSGRNPRRIKRLINSFVLEYHLNRSWDEVGVENLVKVIMLQHFYPTFYRLLTTPGNDDPITDFLQYHDFRSAVKRHAEVDPAQWRPLFEGRDLPVPTVTEESLTSLEAELPDDFPDLSADRDFVALLKSFQDTGIATRRLHRLLRRRPLTTSSTPVRFLEQHNLFRERVPVLPEQKSPDTLAGLNILWIDDNPGTNRRLTAALTERGANVVQATNRAEAENILLRHQTVDAILTDVQRGVDLLAGVTDLEYLRDLHLFDGPVLFCSGRALPIETRLRIEDLEAEGPTNDENEIVSWLARVARERGPDESATRA